jgi:L-alanine-DL-glutamate epimerase-like enolase superfamily enzyme
MNKREFIRLSSMIAGGTFLDRAVSSCVQSSTEKKRGKSSSNSLKLRFKTYTLQLKHAFTLATSSRTTTPVMLTEIEYQGITGYGEGSMPPYLGESHETATKFLSIVDLSQFNDPFLIEDILGYVDGIMAGNYAAKASVDIALHDLIGKLVGKPLYRLFGLNPQKTPLTSFTIGFDTPEIVKQKVAEAEAYRILKVKLGRENDREMIDVIRSSTDKPLCVDVNQGWKDKKYALEMAQWLKEKGVIFLEQPMPKEQADDIAWLTQNSPLPVVGDESIQNIHDLLKYKDVYSGVNIKLMKCGGIRSALKMIQTAKALGMKVMIGCMTETSCAVTAAAQLSPLVDWCDLDGNLLINNDPFDGIKIVGGKVILPDRSGIGVEKIA